MPAKKRYALVRAAAAAVFLAPSSGCASITFDLSDIEEPVMLNGLPYSGAAWRTKGVGEYFSAVSHATGGASGPGYTSRTGESFENDAQLKAFEAIGGHKGRAIGIESIEAWGGGVNLLLAYVAMSAVNVKGKVVEIERGGEAK